MDDCTMNYWIWSDFSWSDQFEAMQNERQKNLVKKQASVNSGIMWLNWDYGTIIYFNA